MFMPRNHHRNVRPGFAGNRLSALAAIATFLAAAVAVAAELPTGTWEELETYEGSIGYDFMDGMRLQLNDGRFFSINGILDPSDCSLTPVAPKPDKNIQGNRAQCILPDNRYFACGGWWWYNNNHELAPTFIYDPAADQWTEMAVMPELITDAVALPLESGEVFVAGGRDLYSFDASLKTWYFNLDSNTWRQGPDMMFPLRGSYDRAMRTFPQNNLKAYVTNRELLFSFDPQNAAYTKLTNLPAYSDNHTIAQTNFIYHFDQTYGGETEHHISAYDFVTGGNTDLPKLPIRLADSAWDDVFPVGLSDGRNNFHAYIHRRHPEGSSSSSDGTWSVRALDPDTDEWMEISSYETDPSFYAYRTSMDDGFLLFFKERREDNSYQTHLVRFSVEQQGGPIDPRVVDDQPATLSIDEGTTYQLAYHVEGSIPAGGLDVVVERVSGDGDLRVLNGPRQRVYSTMDAKTVDLAALIDADANNDQATIRIRIDFPDKTDPNARSIAVTTTDQTAEATHLKGDVNADGLVNIDDLDESERHFGIHAYNQ